MWCFHLRDTSIHQSCVCCVERTCQVTHRKVSYTRGENSVHRLPLSCWIITLLMLQSFEQSLIAAFLLVKVMRLQFSQCLWLAGSRRSISHWSAYPAQLKKVMLSNHFGLRFLLEFFWSSAAFAQFSLVNLRVVTRSRNFVYLGRKHFFLQICPHDLGIWE